MSIINEIRNEASKTLTENGDLAYRSTFNKNLDFFGTAAASRNHQDEVARLFDDAYYEDTILALQNALYLRDIRGGLGERDSFRTCIRELHEIAGAEMLSRLMPFIVEYGRWDDLLVYLEYADTAQMAADYISDQLRKDLEAKRHDESYSLCAKWLPSPTTSSNETRRMAKKLCKLMDMDERSYRKMLSMLRNGMIVERNMTDKDYSFDYAKLPSKALNKHIDAFKRNDAERYDAYVESLKSGEVTAKVKTLYPYEIVANVYKDEELADQQWHAIERYTDRGNTIVVRDGSGSMTWSEGSVRPLDVATSLAILFSEQLTGEFEGKFITFSDHPELIEIPEKCATIAEKVRFCDRYDDVANTDIEAVYNLLLKASKTVKDTKDYISRVVIISDMEFDEGCDNVPTYESMKAKFEGAGIPLPEVVFWNVNARSVHFAAKADQPNIRLVSGMSQNTIKAIIENDSIDAVKFMRDTLEPYKEAAEKIATC